MNYFERIQSVKMNIGFYRRKAGLTQEQLAEKLNISRTHLSSIESKNSTTSVSLQLLFEIADTLNVDIAKLLEHR